MRSHMRGTRTCSCHAKAPAPPLAIWGLAVLILLSVSVLCRAADDISVEPNGSDLTEMSIEDLMNMEITSVAKKAQRLSDAAAAIFVVTSEDIRRSGATCIPDLLRMVPGLEVARIDANKWAITSRGFNGRFSTKLLVLMDGRTVYSPIYSGVFWDEQDTLLEDVERIEVIRGPGATMWGANAVNGVINIITKNSKDTQGGILSAGAGTEEKGFGSVRYGSKTGTGVTYRVYAKYFNKDDGVYSNGEEAADGWNAGRTGFRVDYMKSGSDSFTIQGDYFYAREGQTDTIYSLDPPYSSVEDTKTRFRGGNIIGKWIHDESTVQFYYDRDDRTAETYDLVCHNFDFDFLSRAPLGDSHEITWGLGYRFSQDNVESTFTTGIYPSFRSYSLANAFIQDEISLAKDVLSLTIGSKFEHNSFTGYEVQPGVKLMWTPNERNSLWLSVARAVRTPSRAEDDGSVTTAVIPPGSYYPGQPLTSVTFRGNHDFESEELLAYEMGYRVIPVDRLSIDIAAFYNVYDELRTVEPGGQGFETLPEPHAVLYYEADNKMDGYSYGAEAALDMKVMDWWRLQPSYTYIQMHLTPYSSSQYNKSTQYDDDVPKHQVGVRSLMNLRENVDFDLWYRYVDELTRQNVPSYSTLDARIAWRPDVNLELSLVGQNLLEARHLEFRPEIMGVAPTEVERSVYAKVAWKF